MQFIVSARQTAHLVDELKAADWKRSPQTDAEGQCESWYQLEGWSQAHRLSGLVALINRTWTTQLHSALFLGFSSQSWRFI